MVAKVKDVYSRAKAGASQPTSTFCPVDIEWAYRDEKLYLLQARPVTYYISLFPEMITLRGDSKKNLYMDAVVVSQEFSEPFSTLGFDVWKTMVGHMKPQMFESDGPNSAMWHIHGREYIHVSNLMKTTVGRITIEKMIGNYDSSIGRALASIDLEDYSIYR